MRSARSRIFPRDAGDVEQVVDQAAHVTSLPLDDLQHLDPVAFAVIEGHRLGSVDDARQRIAELMAERREKLVLSLIRLAELFRLFANRLLGVLAIGHVASGAGDGDDCAVRVKNRREDVVIDPPAVRTGEGNLAPNRLLLRDDLFDLAVVHLGVPLRVAQLETVLADRLVPRAAPHREQGFVRVGEAVIEIEDVDEVGRVRKGRFIHAATLVGFLLESSEFVARAATIGDVGVRAEPANDGASLVANGHRPRQMPPHLSVVSPERKRVVEGYAGLEGRLPARDDAIDFVGIVNALPTPAFHLLGRCAGVVVPALVVPEDPAVGPGHPGELRNTVGERAELLLGVAESSFGLQAFGDVFAGSKNADDLARLVRQRHFMRVEPVGPSVFAGDRFENVATWLSRLDDLAIGLLEELDLLVRCTGRSVSVFPTMSAALAKPADVAASRFAPRYTPSRFFQKTPKGMLSSTVCSIAWLSRAAASA